MNKLLPYKNKWKHGYIDHKGNVVIPFIYKDAKFFSEGLAHVLTEDDKWGYFSRKGKLVIPTQWSLASDFDYEEETAFVYDMDSMISGYIDTTCRFFNPSHPLDLSAEEMEYHFSNAEDFDEDY